MSELVSMREFSRRRGVALNAVQKAVKSGRLTLIQDGRAKKLDFEQAMIDWTQNRDDNFLPKTDVKPEVNLKDKVPSFATSRAIREAYEARIKRLDFEERAKKLISVDLVKKEATELAHLIRNAVLGVPGKIAAELAAEVNPHEVEKRLDKELRDTLEGLSCGKFVQD